MATHITQTEDSEHNRMILRIDGDMHREDAELLEKIAEQLRSGSDMTIVIDLAELDLMDSDAAAVLRRIESQEGFLIEGVEIFVQSAVNESERIKN